MTTIIENIHRKTANKIKKLNNEYLVWADDSEITAIEIQQYFMVTKYDNEQVNLEHKTQDFRIENILL